MTTAEPLSTGWEATSGHRIRATARLREALEQRKERRRAKKEGRPVRWEYKVEMGQRGPDRWRVYRRRVAA